MRRQVLRSALSTVAVSGAATLAGVFALAPGAFATITDDPAPGTTPTTEAAPTPDVTVTPDVAVTPDVPPAQTTPSATPAPEPTSTSDKGAKALAVDFGIQKFRIGVQIADGSWVPAGTSTAGSTFTITETGPHVTNNEGDSVPSYTFTCRTTSTSIEDGSTASFCNNDAAPLRRASSAPESRVSASAAEGGVTVDPRENDDHGDQVYRAAPGSTVKITQLTAGANLLKTPNIATIERCDGTVEFFPDLYCEGRYNADTRLNTVLFANPGLPPVAADDVRTTDLDTPIDIDVLTNDDTVNGAPLVSVAPITSPANGTVTVKGTVTPAPTPTPTPTPTETSPTEGPIGESSVHAAATGPVITYVPKKGFTGTDTFTYSLSTPNGTATANVTITIRDTTRPAKPADPTDDGSGSGDGTGDGDGPLPDAGGFDQGLLILGSSLLAGGGALTVVARQRLRGRDAHLG